MKRADGQLPDQLYQKVEGPAQQLHLSVPEPLRHAAEQIIRSQPSPRLPGKSWRARVILF